MHLGTLRTAYFNWLIARATGGEFILRIDDTDQSRNDDSKVTDIYSIMEWAGLDFNRTFRQGDPESLDWYRTNLETLKKKGRVRLQDGAYFLDFPEGVPSHWTDTVAGDIQLTDEDHKAIANLVVWRSNDTPTYHFASVCDDVKAGITWVVRGKDHLSNTPKQIVIFNALGQPLPQFSHIGLLTQNKKKLSKREGAASCLRYRDEGLDPEVLLNFILRMGWGPAKDDKSMVIIDRQRALSLFMNDGRMKNSDSNVDLDQLAALARKYTGRAKRLA
jgi:glutamyl-tRNA synthetase